MDEDLFQMTRDELIEEVRRLRLGQSVSIVDSTPTRSFVGTILPFGGYCRKRQIRSL